MRTIRAIVVEDEPNSRVLLTKTLQQFCENVKVVATAASIVEAVKVIPQYDCDVVFMDVELQDGKSFEILECLGRVDFRIVFTTAYDEFAFKAFKLEATDYLLKPYSPAEVVNAVRKVRDAISNDVKNSSYNSIDREKARFKLNTRDGIELVSQSNIVYCSADGSYVHVHMEDGATILISKALKQVESMVLPDVFERVHSSFLINMNHVKKYIKADGGFVEMTNGDVLPISRRKKQGFLEKLA